MEMGGGSSSSIATPQRRFVPRCGCCEPMRMNISNSDNPQKRYWKCVNWNSKDSCKLFIWDDQLTQNKASVVSSDPSLCTACQYARILLDAGTKKIKKLKLKAIREEKCYDRCLDCLLPGSFFFGYEAIT